MRVNLFRTERAHARRAHARLAFLGEDAVVEEGASLAQNDTHARRAWI